MTVSPALRVPWIALLLLATLWATCPVVAGPPPATSGPGSRLASRVSRLDREIDQILGRFPSLKVGLAIRHLPTGLSLSRQGRSLFPLASVSKVPVLIEAGRQLQARTRGLELDTRLLLGEADRCLGSGRLQDQPPGTEIPFGRALELMQTVSDNTAMDLVWERLGPLRVQALMDDLGLKSAEILLKNRTAWLISLGVGSPFRGLRPRQIANRWRGLSRAERLQAARRVEEESQGMTLARFRALEEASDGRQTHAENAAVAEAVDNVASPADLSRLLGWLWQGRILDARWTRYTLDLLARQRFKSRIPRLLPPNVPVYHKTGTIAGVVNDAGILEASPEDPVVVVVLVKGVDPERVSSAEELIGLVAQATWEAFRP